MRRVFYAPWPHTDEDIAAAEAAGAGELLDGDSGYVEILEPLDDPQAAKAAQLTRLADRRWSASQAVPYVFGGKTYLLPCDNEAGTNVLGAIVGLQLAPNGPIVWKMGDDFNALTFDDLVAMGQAMRHHVQACFENEARLAARIRGAQRAGDALALDLEGGWP